MNNPTPATAPRFLSGPGAQLSPPVLHHKYRQPAA